MSKNKVRRDQKAWIDACNKQSSQGNDRSRDDKLLRDILAAQKKGQQKPRDDEE